MRSAPWWLPAGLCFAFGRMVGDMRQGWAVLGAMTAIFIVFAVVVLIAEQQAHPALQALGVIRRPASCKSGGNMDGKETRLGISASALFAAITTAASCGAVNAINAAKYTPAGSRIVIAAYVQGESLQLAVYDNEQGLIDAGTRKPDIVILDLGLPDGDGMEFIFDVRKWSAVPIIVLSARAGEIDKIAALDAGADDYLSKPFGVGELLARVRSAWRRQHSIGATAQGIIQFGDITLDVNARLVTKAKQRVNLPPNEYRLLLILADNAGRVVSASQLLRQVWGKSHAEDSHYLRIYMGRLRQKLEDDPAQPRYLLTETAVGYRLLSSA